MGLRELSKIELYQIAVSNLNLDYRYQAARILLERGKVNVKG